MTHVFESPAALAAAVGSSLGHSEWREVTQARVAMFAASTGVHQWIHVYTERAAAGPFAGTIAHGFLSLSMLLVLAKELSVVHGYSTALNYGCEKVRFPRTVPVGSRVRVEAIIQDVAETAVGHRVTTRHVMTVEGDDKPACVADIVVLYLR